MSQDYGAKAIAAQQLAEQGRVAELQEQEEQVGREAAVPEELS
jgi:small subunit ribosomal protein S3e